MSLTLAGCTDSRSGFGKEDDAVSACLNALDKHADLAPKDRLGQQAIKALRVKDADTVWEVIGETEEQVGYPTRSFVCEVEKGTDRDHPVGKVFIAKDDRDRYAVARMLAPEVKSFQATGQYVEVEGQPAVTLNMLAGRGSGSVQLLEGMASPGFGERECTTFGLRLVPFGERGAELLPIVADAFEVTFHTRCGVP
jgi:hypothetical protein